MTAPTLDPAAFDWLPPGFRIHDVPTNGTRLSVAVGAMVAFAWAATHPDDVAALVLLDALLPGLGLEEAMNVAEGGMWHFGMFMAPAVPERLFDGHELKFITGDVPCAEHRGHVLRQGPRCVRRGLPRA